MNLIVLLSNLEAQFNQLLSDRLGVKDVCWGFSGVATDPEDDLIELRFRYDPNLGEMLDGSLVLTQAGVEAGLLSQRVLDEMLNERNRNFRDDVRSMLEAGAGRRSDRRVDADYAALLDEREQWERDDERYIERFTTLGVDLAHL